MLEVFILKIQQIFCSYILGSKRNGRVSALSVQICSIQLKQPDLCGCRVCLPKHHWNTNTQVTHTPCRYFHVFTHPFSKTKVLPSNPSLREGLLLGEYQRRPCQIMQRLPRLPLPQESWPHMHELLCRRLVASNAMNTLYTLHQVNTKIHSLY